MTTDIETVEHLRRGMVGLIRKRDELDTLIAEMRNMIMYLGGSPDRVPPHTPAAPMVSPSPPRAAPPEGAPRNSRASTGEPPTTREAILAVLRAEDRTMAMSEIVARAPDFGTTAQNDTIRSLLTKMVKAGVLERPTHGQYRLPESARGEGERESAAGPSKTDGTSGSAPDQQVLGRGNPPDAQRAVKTPSVA